VLVRKSTPDRVLAEIQGTGGKVIKTSLTPSNCDQLLFDDVLWVENAKRDHFDFISKMRDRGIEVVEMHNLLAETVAVPEGKKWDSGGRCVQSVVQVDGVFCRAYACHPSQRGRNGGTRKTVQNAAEQRETGQPQR